MNLDIYGQGLCALVTAACMASTGHNVTLHLNSQALERALNDGEAIDREPGLALLIQEQRRSGRLVLPGESVSANTHSPRVIFVALPPDQQNDAMTLVQAIAEQTVGALLVVNQSTFPVGTTAQLHGLIQHPSNDWPREVVALPDLLQEGAALKGFTRPNQVLLGAESPWAERLIRELLRPFNRREDRIRVMGTREAEFTKLAITGMLATRLSFMNDMANLADSLNVDIESVRQGMGGDRRIGHEYLYPGCGFGGRNFSRDVMNLVSTLEDKGVGSTLLAQVLDINEQQKEVLFRKLWQFYNADLKGRTVALWGAAFKPGSSRIDNAPSIRLIEALIAQGCHVQVHDPEALPALQDEFGVQEGLTYHEDPYNAAIDADALLIVTEWKAYWSPDFTRLKTAMRQAVIFDGRNIYDPAFVADQGFVYCGVGRQVREL
ncbi:NDP-sugar dehydrogenase [Terasakiispira papahanaumokuakeensis]|uniref:UDP-glucose 6-dehydrogenase n=1 Tax=Terasakiispira papahanaumokuakeensis TaxID=197479 RepID=A0A1E2V928_9GAMM|nr:nucleotide sugar dehydrogenase [Terasakiispira papahanaumokuakeensis]ODC03423.1 NDP-sugar dehydrogenase [Terasakiispira papahanaumokuakeensis]